MARYELIFLIPHASHGASDLSEDQQLNKVYPKIMLCSVLLSRTGCGSGLRPGLPGALVRPGQSWPGLGRPGPIQANAFEGWGFTFRGLWFTFRGIWFTFQIS